MKYILYLLFISLGYHFISGNAGNGVDQQKHSLADTVKVPLGGNAWRLPQGEKGGEVSNEGIINWTDNNVSFITYIRISKPLTLHIQLNADVPLGNSGLQLQIGKLMKNLHLTGTSIRTYDAGIWELNDTGYVPVMIKGLNKTGTVFANVHDLIFDGETIASSLNFVKNNDGNFFYWGRRGPSVHLNYQVPDSIQAEWFYNEVTVPEGKDKEGAFFMADGFSAGYFGMQVNSSSERRILFSVWSPYATDHPEQIPEDQKVILLKKGASVHGGEFGNEGSGGQSYMRYNWKPGITYSFLLHCEPDTPAHTTTYTAYFYAPETKRWFIVASFRRPKTLTYLKHLHSFLENFIPEEGNSEREVLFTNQWLRTSSGQWIEINKARFTGDNTAVKGFRMDYSGGIKQNDFYLRHCGFFSDYTKLGGIYQRNQDKDVHPDDQVIEKVKKM